MEPPLQYSAEQLLLNPTSFSQLDPPARLAVFGDPIAHSLSPPMQNAALQAYSLPYQYIRIHATADQFPLALRALPSAGFLGANVTIPHKIAALQLADSPDPFAQLAGSANTLLVENSRLLAFNTDGPALPRAIREEFYVDLRDLRVLLLGAGGGAGRAFAAQCAIERCERLVLVNRTYDKAAQLAQILRPYFSSDRLLGPAERCIAIPFQSDFLAREIAHSDLVINATSLGLRRSDPSPLPLHLLTPNLLLFDSVYSTAKTKLLLDAEAVGARSANGLSLLLHQGALAFEIWFNRPAPIETMRTALLKATATPSPR
ncbi:MAG: shikimate dehydrogenase [Chthoniobacterales bacterium]|nr:shikimate dehydrogenase [Chthoniobacterales bacterium]